MDPAATSTTLFSRAATLGRGALASRLLGFVRDALLAYALGGGWVADAFFVAFRLPNFMRRLLAEGSLNLCVIPALKKMERLQGEKAAFALARSSLALFVLSFSAVALCGMALAKPLALLLAPGLAFTPSALDMAALLLMLCLPYAPLAAGAAVSSGLLMAKGRFLVPSLTPLVLNLVLILFALAALFSYPVLPGTGVISAKNSAILLCAGVVAGGGMQWLCQIPALHGLGFSLRGPSSLRHPEGRAVLAATPAALFGAATHQVNVLAATFLASFLAQGSIAALYFAERLIELPFGVIGASLGLAALATLAALHAKADREAFRAALESALRLGLFFSLPAAVGLVFLALPLVQTLFGHGAFSGEAQAATAGALAAYTLGLPALVASRALLSALSVLGDSTATARAALISLLMTLALGAALLTLTPWSGPWAVALAASLAAWGNVFFLWRSLARLSAAPAMKTLIPLSHIAACCALALALAGLRSFSLSPLAHLNCAVLPGILLYGGTALALGSGEARLCLQCILRRKVKQ